MSTKTLRKRIALVAVSAMGLGLLSAVVAPTANAAVIVANDIVFAPATSTENISLIDVCRDTSTATVQTATIPLTSSGISISATAGAAANGYITVSGPGVIASKGSAWTLDSNVAATVSVSGTAANNLLKIKPTATGTITITTSATSTSAALDVLTVTVVDKCSNGTYSAAESGVALQTAQHAGETWTLTNVDDPTADVVANGGTGYIRLKLNDTYGQDLSADNLVATVTSGTCRVSIDAYSAASTYGAGSTKTASAISNVTAADHVVSVAQSVTNAPTVCTVSITFGGTAVATKSIKFRGVAAKLVVSDQTVGATNGYGYYRVKVLDSAGNAIPSASITTSSTEANNVAALAVVSNAQSNTVSTASDGITPDVADGSTSAARFNCTSKGGSAKITVRTNTDTNSTTFITSDPFTVNCGGALDTWSISFDKASYAPGEIATLTVSGKDADGYAVKTYAAMTGIEYSFGGMTAVTAPTSSDTFSSGVGYKTYKFSVGTTEGAFVGTYKITGATDTTAKTIQYKVASSSASVTNAEVLAAIVKLIASINKQITALQKLLTKKK